MLGCFPCRAQTATRLTGGNTTSKYHHQNFLFDHEIATRQFWDISVKNQERPVKARNIDLNIVL